ncbi:MAG: hypothetical protein AB1553_11205 [Nitrospirota bacterium]
MKWYKQRVWQMGAGALMILFGAWLAYSAAAGEMTNTPLLWTALALIFFGLLIPLMAKALEAAQDKGGEENES